MGTRKRLKKRTKAYSGADAKTQTPTVHRYTAPVRSPLGDWWFEHKRALKLTSIIGGSALIIIWLLFELIGLVF
jgi:hypothetical protein